MGVTLTLTNHASGASGDSGDGGDGQSVADVDVVPEVISYGGASQPQLLLAPAGANSSAVDGGSSTGVSTGSFSFQQESGGSWSLNVNASHAVTSTVIYGRNFKKDTLPYSC
jgi:hypothetical protein